MQARGPKRSNPERSQATRQALVAAARGLFVEAGFAGTSTPAVVAAASVTRGALYHHFRDKLDLLRAVLEQEARAVAADIEAATPADMPPRQALLAGAAAYLAAMQVPGRTRLLLIEGPGVIGLAAMRALDAAHAERTLAEGLAAVLANEDAQKHDVGKAEMPRPALAVGPLTVLLSAAFDRTALAIVAGEDAAAFQSTLFGMLERILGFERSVDGEQQEGSTRRLKRG